jgi:hypothetical protein
MAHAYTPGLRLSERETVVRLRRLPDVQDTKTFKVPRVIRVKVGDLVRSEQIVATSALPGAVEIINLTNKLNVAPSELPDVLLVKADDSVSAGQVVARTKGLFGRFFRSEFKIETSGIIENISTVTGSMTIRKSPEPVEIPAYIDGRVREVVTNSRGLPVGVNIEATAAFLQGIFGISGETYGDLLVLAASREETLSPDKIVANCRDKIIVAGAFAPLETVLRAREMGAKGFIVGGLQDDTIDALLPDTPEEKAKRGGLPKRLGVAITGNENTGLTVILTEGFGPMPMSEKAFKVLSRFNGSRASINGATQVRAGVMRPEIIIPLSESELSVPATVPTVSTAGGLQKNTRVRIIRSQRDTVMGAMGTIMDLPKELRLIETEAMVRVCEVKLDDGAVVVVPRANVEIVEG